LHMQFN